MIKIHQKNEDDFGLKKIETFFKFKDNVLRSKEKLIKLLNNRSINASIIRNEIELVNFLKSNGKPGDLFICLGAGSISQWVNKLPDYLCDSNIND